MDNQYDEEYTLRLALQGRHLANVLANVSTSYVTILFELIREHVIPYLRELSIHSANLHEKARSRQ